MKSVREIMEQEVSFCKTDDSLKDVAEMMRTRNVGSIPVCDGNKHLIGMVTDRDLVIRGYAYQKDGSAKVNEVMSEHLYQVSPDATLQEASDMMADHQIRRLPVTADGKLIGILSLGDLSLDDMSDQSAGQALEQISEHTELQ